MKISWTTGGLVAPALLAILFASLNVGCAPTQPQNANATVEDDGHDEFASVGDAVAALSEQYATIKAAFEGGSPGDAHGALHEVGHTLTAIEEMIQEDADMTEEEKAAADEGVQSLSDAFTALDGTMHGVEGEVDFSELSSKIEDAMTKLPEKK